MIVKDRAEHWDLTTRVMWNDITYVNGLDALLKKRRVNGESIERIYDAACGTGFPALLLAARGYKVRCSDGDDAMLAVFEKNLKETQAPVIISHERKKWSELTPFADFSAQMVMVRGNSLVYAPSWDCEDKKYTLNPEEADEKIFEALTKFREQLMPDGLLYVDIMHRFEKEGEILVGQKRMGQSMIQLSFNVQYIPEHQQRQVISTLLQDGFFLGEPRVYNSYLLSHERLMYLLQSAGFTDIEPHVPLRGESHYSVFLARKR